MEFLRLREELKENFRAVIKRESGVVLGCKENALSNDGYGSFFGPSETVFPERLVQDSKAWLNHDFIRELTQLKGKKSSSQSKKANIIVDKEKVQWLRASRDYSFLSCDDDKPEGPMIKPFPVKKVSRSFASHQLLGAKKLQELDCTEKPVSSVEKASNSCVSKESRKEKLSPKKPAVHVKKASKESSFQESRKEKLMPRKPPVKQRKHAVSHDKGDCEAKQAIGMIRKMFGYDPSKFTEDADDRNMEASFSDILKEENRSTKIAMKEDAEELKKIEEEEKMQRKKRKMK